MALVPGVRPILEIGGRVFTDLTNIILLYTYVSSNNGTYRKPDGSAGYQITAGKTYKAQAALVTIHAVSAGSGITLLYSDNDVGISSASGFTNAVYLAGASTVASIFTTSTIGQFSVAINFNVVAQKYAGTSAGGGTAQVIIYGYEV